MYWSRTGQADDFAAFLLMCSLWALGGWLLTSHVVRLRRRERIIGGLATGLALFIPLSSLIGGWVGLPLGWWAAAGVILTAGWIAAWRSPHRARLSPADLRSWPEILALVGLTLLFALINRGLAIFDDYHNLPLVSTIAAGEMPPHFYLNPDLRYAYHYGLHLFASALVRVGGFFPWSAFDLSNAFVLALTLVLAGLWLRRVTHSAAAGILGSAALAFTGGARWLLLLIPLRWLRPISDSIDLIGSGAATSEDMLTSLSLPWSIEGGGTVPFPFAHVSGILTPLIHSMTGSGAFPVLVPVLLLMLARRRWNGASATLFALALASLALTAETVFVVLWLGILGATAAGAVARRTPRRASQSGGWLWVLGLSILAAAAQGGILTEAVRNALSFIRPGSAEASYGFGGFSPQWPPAVVSVHFGNLHLNSASQVVVALAELGPALLLSLPVSACLWMWIRRGRYLYAAMGMGAVLAFLLSLVLRYEVERDTTRITATALTFWLILGLPVVWHWAKRGSGLVRGILGLGYAASVLSGVTLFAVGLTAIPEPRASYFVDSLDTRISRAHWNRLDPGDQVFDRLPYRAVTLFGRPVRAHQSMYAALPEWEALLENPEPGLLARAGFDYVYLDDTWWWDLTEQQRAPFEAPCVRVVEGVVDDMAAFRRLADIRGCR